MAEPNATFVSTNLIGVLEFTSPDKVLFGSDWPYAPFGTSKDLTKRFEAFLKSEEGIKLQGAVRKNAIELFGSKR